MSMRGEGRKTYTEDIQKDTNTPPAHLANCRAAITSRHRPAHLQSIAVSLDGLFYSLAQRDRRNLRGACRDAPSSMTRVQVVA